MDPVLLNLGNIEIRYYSILILMGAIIGIVLATLEARKFHLGDDFIFNLCFWALIFGLIGARIYYVAFNWEMYAHNLLDIFKVWNGGLAIHGGIFAGLVSVIIYCKKHHKDIIRITDILSTSLIIAQSLGRWGNFFNGEAHGMATSLIELKGKLIPEFVINGMNIGGIYYIPTFYYESIWCLIGFIVIMLVRRLKYTKIGQQTCIYFMWYSFGRFFIESLRTDSLMLAGFKVAQIVSILLFIVSLVAFMIISRKGKFEDLYNENKDTKVKYFK